MKQHHKYSFTLESEGGIFTRECTASFCVLPAVKGTLDEPPSPAEVDWFDFSAVLVPPSGNSYPYSYGTRDVFEKWARMFTGNPEWSISDFDNEALQIADDYEEGKREEAWEAKAEARREARLEDLMEATTRGDN